MQINWAKNWTKNYTKKLCKNWAKKLCILIVQKSGKKMYEAEDL